MRNEEKVEKLCMEIWNNICRSKGNDNELLEDIEDGLDDDPNGYTTKDYKKLVFNILDSYKKNTSWLKNEINNRDELIKHLYNKIIKINKFKIDLSEFMVYANSNELPIKLDEVDIIEAIDNLKKKT